MSNYQPEYRRAPQRNEDFDHVVGELDVRQLRTPHDPFLLGDRQGVPAGEVVQVLLHDDVAAGDLEETLRSCQHIVAIPFREPRLAAHDSEAVDGDAAPGGDGTLVLHPGRRGSTSREGRGLNSVAQDVDYLTACVDAVHFELGKGRLDALAH